MNSNRMAIVLLILFFAFHSTSTYAQSPVATTWTGGVGNWSDPNDWNPSTVPNNNPAIGDYFGVTIGSNSVVTMDLLNVSISELTLSGTSSLNINAPNTLTLLLGSPSSNSGVINNSGSFLADSALNNYGTLNNAGTFGIGSCCGTTNFGTINNIGTFSNAGGFDNQGTFNNFGNILNPAEAFTSNEGTLNNFGTFVNQGAAVSNSATLNNFGTLVIEFTNNTGILYNSGTITNVVILDNSGALYNSGTFNSVGALTNSGSVTISNSGLLTTSSNYTQTAGNTIVNGTLTASNGALVNIQGGALTGTGTINGNVLLAGTMMPGNPTGPFTINGNYIQTSGGTLVEEVGWIDGMNASLLRVNGTATLDGTLALTLLNGFDPTVGDSFILMTFLQGYGAFNTTTGLNLGNNEFLQLFYDPTDVRAVVEQTPEPASILLVLVGLIGIAFAAMRAARGA